MLYQLLAGGNEMLRPRFPEDMSCVKVAGLAASCGKLRVSMVRLGSEGAMYGG